MILGFTPWEMSQHVGSPKKKKSRYQTHSLHDWLWRGTTSLDGAVELESFSLFGITLRCIYR